MAKNMDAGKTARQAIDPVCKMVITVDSKTLKIDHGEHGHYFCSEKCRRDFEKDPTKYH